MEKVQLKIREYLKSPHEPLLERTKTDDGYCLRDTAHFYFILADGTKVYEGLTGELYNLFSTLFLDGPNKFPMDRFDIEHYDALIRSRTEGFFLEEFESSRVKDVDGKDFPLKKYRDRGYSLIVFSDPKIDKTYAILSNWYYDDTNRPSPTPQARILVVDGASEEIRQALKKEVLTENGELKFHTPDANNNPTAFKQYYNGKSITVEGVAKTLIAPEPQKTSDSLTGNKKQPTTKGNSALFKKLNTAGSVIISVSSTEYSIKLTDVFTQEEKDILGQLIKDSIDNSILRINSGRNDKLASPGYYYDDKGITGSVENLDSNDPKLKNFYKKELNSCLEIIKQKIQPSYKPIIQNFLPDDFLKKALEKAVKIETANTPENPKRFAFFSVASFLREKREYDQDLFVADVFKNIMGSFITYAKNNNIDISGKNLGDLSRALMSNVGTAKNVLTEAQTNDFIEQLLAGSLEVDPSIYGYNLDTKNLDAYLEKQSGKTPNPQTQPETLAASTTIPPLPTSPKPQTQTVGSSGQQEKGKAVIINEFSTGRIAQGTQEEFFSRGFSGAFMNKSITGDIPEKIQSLISNSLFKLKEGQAINKSEGGSVIAHEAYDSESKKYYQILAVVTRQQDERGRSAQMNRWFYAESPSNDATDRNKTMGALVKYVSELEDKYFQPFAYDNSGNVVERSPQPTEVEINTIDINPVNYEGDRSYIKVTGETLEDVFKKALSLQKDEQLLGFAFNVKGLENKHNLQIIANFNEEAQQTNELKEYKEFLSLDFDASALKGILRGVKGGNSSQAIEENKKRIIRWAEFADKSTNNIQTYEILKNSHIELGALNGDEDLSAFKVSLFAYLSNSVSKEDFLNIFNAINKKRDNKNYQDFIDGISSILKNNPSIFKNQSAEFSNLLYTQADSFLKLLEKDSPKKGLFGKKAKDSPIKTSIVALFTNVKKLEKGTRVAEDTVVKTTITEPETPTPPTPPAASTTIPPLPPRQEQSQGKTLDEILSNIAIPFYINESFEDKTIIGSNTYLPYMFENEAIAIKLTNALNTYLDASDYFIIQRYIDDGKYSISTSANFEDLNTISQTKSLNKKKLKALEDVIKEINEEYAKTQETIPTTSTVDKKL